MAFDLDDPRAALRDQLNASCFCIDVSREGFWAEVAARIGTEAAAGLAEGREHLISPSPAFITRQDLERMETVVRAVEAAAALPGFQHAVLAHAAPLARRDTGARGMFMGYDFHLGDEGPRLIEVNTNAGGAFLVALAARAEIACCPEVAAFAGDSLADGFETAAVEMVRAEWRAAGRSGQPQRVAIVDEAPEGQFLYPEFLLVQALLRDAGMAAEIAAPGDLAFDGSTLTVRGAPVDFVYNRLTDFSLASSHLAPLAAALDADAIALSPGPRHHALLADKRNLVWFSDPERLVAMGLDPLHAAALRSVPATVDVTPENAADLWARRNGLFFKPAGGHAGKRVYRGDKLTRRVWDEITSAQDYVAQAFCPPTVREVKVDEVAAPRKMDVRLYTYAGRTLLVAARLYAGQTTNFRTPGGGFSPVIALS